VSWPVGRLLEVVRELHEIEIHHDHPHNEGDG
jgi:hypothetical protein